MGNAITYKDLLSMPTSYFVKLYDLYSKKIEQQSQG